MKNVAHQWSPFINVYPLRKVRETQPILLPPPPRYKIGYIETRNGKILKLFCKDKREISPSFTFKINPQYYTVGP